jgi:hypothetical protein
MQAVTSGGVLDVEHDDRLLSVCWHEDLDGFVIIADGALVERTLDAIGDAIYMGFARLSQRRSNSPEPKSFRSTISIQIVAPELGSTGDVSAACEVRSGFLCFMPNALFIHGKYLAIAHDHVAVNHDQRRFVSQSRVNDA